MTSARTQNLYVYTANNPVNMVDPTGHYASFLQPRNQQVTVLCDTGTNNPSPIVVPDPDETTTSGESNGENASDSSVSDEIADLVNTASLSLNLVGQISQITTLTSVDKTVKGAYGLYKALGLYKGNLRRRSIAAQNRVNIWAL